MDLTKGNASSETTEFARLNATARIRSKLF
uniref:Uncharacterized protein n=1 Tax=Anguilla anguilla TaxID=7936 RepID=A0A0E9UMX3_ANGAN